MRRENGARMARERRESGARTARERRENGARTARERRENGAIAARSAWVIVIGVINHTTHQPHPHISLKPTRHTTTRTRGRPTPRKRPQIHKHTGAYPPPFFWECVLHICTPAIRTGARFVWLHAHAALPPPLHSLTHITATTSSIMHAGGDA